MKLDRRASAIFCLLLFACAAPQSVPPAPSTPPSAQTPPAEPPPEGKVEPEIEAVPREAHEVLADFIKAVNASDENGAERSCRAECWRGSCGVFLERFKNQLKLHGQVSVKGDRARAALDVVSGNDVRDDIYVYLKRGTDGWLVAEVHNDADDSDNFLAHPLAALDRSTAESTVRAWFASINEREYVAAADRDR